jgi:hypothetical protein
MLLVMFVFDVPLLPSQSYYRNRGEVRVRSACSHTWEGPCCSIVFVLSYSFFLLFHRYFFNTTPFETKNLNPNFGLLFFLLFPFLSYIFLAATMFQIYFTLGFSVGLTRQSFFLDYYCSFPPPKFHSK